MLFNSVDYLILLAASLGAYWALPWLRARQLVVFVASCWFYMSWSKSFLLMLLALIAVNWLLAGRLERDGRRIWLVLGCILNLGLLAYFKYAKFLVDNLLAVAGLFDPGLQPPHFEIILPLGISFYVFELISYLADVHRKKAVHERSLLTFSLFVLFFPHLIAGPICRAGQFLPQVRTLQKPEAGKAYNGLYFFLAGFALKCGIADGVAPYVNVIFESPARYSGFDNLFAAIGFGVQILCDFWGYSLMALGAALLFGYVLPPNFNAPYAALSIRDFWRRWHITLSNWLRDYLYIALGGSRTDRAWKVQRNLFLTMVLGGLWHGASWNFVVWGALHGGALAVNRWFDDAPLPRWAQRTFRWAPAAWLLTMVVVFVGWVFFRAHSFGSAMAMLAQAVHVGPGWAATRLEPVFFELLALYLVLQWLVHRTTTTLDMAVQPVRWQLAGVAVLTTVAAVYYVDGNAFIYFQF